MDEAIKVAVADDHPVVRRGLRSFLDSIAGFVVVGEADSGSAAVDLVERRNPDVLLLDLFLPELEGIDVIKRIRAAGLMCKILVLTSFSGQETVIAAVEAGANGYLLKDAEPRELEEAIKAVHRGDASLAPQAASAVISAVADQTQVDPGLEQLTPREQEVLAGLGRGLTNKQLADELVVSEKTVKTHVSRVLMKLGLTDRTQAALYAVKVGLADPR